jgi:hydroxyacylglutathione hydrolase
MNSTLIVHNIRNRFFSSNTYLLTEKETKETVVIDPGVDFDRIWMTIEDLGLLPVGIICTHGHFDHLGCVSLLKKKYNNIPFALHQRDIIIAKAANFYAKLAKLQLWIDFVSPDIIMSGNAGTLEFSSYKLHYVNYPGHTDGSCVINISNLIFSGDFIYNKGLGINNLPGENKAILKRSIEFFFNDYSNDFMIYPGHGEPNSLHAIRQGNMELNNFLNN